MVDDLNEGAAVWCPPEPIAVQQLYLENIDFIRETIHSDPTLRFDTAEKLIESLAGQVRAYCGPLNEAEFRRWVLDVILPAASFAAIYEHCSDSVRTAIRKVFSTCLDLGITPDHYGDAEQNTWLWAWQHLKELRDAAKSRASTKTRLYAAAKFQALTIRKSLLRARDRISDVSPSRIGFDPYESEYTGPVVEPLSPDGQFDPYERRETVGAAA